MLNDLIEKCLIKPLEKDVYAGLSFPEYCEKRLKVIDKEGQLVPFNLNLTQMKLWRTVQHIEKNNLPKRIVVGKGRQVGTSLFCLAFGLWFASESPNTTCLVVSKTDDETKSLMRKMGIMWEEDPIAPPIKTPSSTKLEFINRSLVFAKTFGTKGGAARGETVHGLAHISELAHSSIGPNQYTEQKTILRAAIMRTLTKSAWCIVESTANGAEYYKELWDEAVAGKNEFTPVFVGWWLEKENTVFAPEDFQLTTDEKALKTKHPEISNENFAWRRAEKRNMGANLFNQENPDSPELMFLMKGVCFFNIPTLQSRLGRMSQYAPAIQTWADGSSGYIETWEKPKPGKQYIAGLDSAEGLEGSDNSVCIILERNTGRQVHQICGRIKPDKFAELSVKALRKYNNAFACVENVGIGQAVLMRMKQLDYYKASQIYYDGNKAGLNMTFNRRCEILELLRKAVDDEDFDWIQDKSLLIECQNFRKNKNKYEASSSSWDDRIMANAMALYLRNDKPIDFSLAFRI